MPLPTRSGKLIPGFPIWLNDSRRLLFPWGSSLFLVDIESKQQRELLSIAPASFSEGPVRLSPDDRTIYFTRTDAESDIWMLTLE